MSCRHCLNRSLDCCLSEGLFLSCFFNGRMLFWLSARQALLVMLLKMLVALKLCVSFIRIYIFPLEEFWLHLRSYVQALQLGRLWEFDLFIILSESWLQH